MTRPDGTPVNAVYGFTQMMLKLIEETDADHIAVIFDRARKTFRSDIYPEYKAHRPRHRTTWSPNLSWYAKPHGR